MVSGQDLSTLTSQSYSARVGGLEVGSMIVVRGVTITATLVRGVRGSAVHYGT